MHRQILLSRGIFAFHDEIIRFSLLSPLAHATTLAKTHTQERPSVAFSRKGGRANTALATLHCKPWAHTLGRLEPSRPSRREVRGPLEASTEGTSWPERTAFPGLQASQTLFSEVFPYRSQAGGRSSFPGRRIEAPWGSLFSNIGRASERRC